MCVHRICSAAVIAIDVAEGTALASLDGLSNMLETWPHQFDCIEDAIDWSGKNPNIPADLSQIIGSLLFTHRVYRSPPQPLLAVLVSAVRQAAEQGVRRALGASILDCR